MAIVLEKSRNVDYQFKNVLNDYNQDFYEIEKGLMAHQKYILPKYFYDEAGQGFFDLISASEDYYISRAEVEILADNAAEIAEIIGEKSVLIEPGCGNCSKVEHLLKKLRPEIYLMIDIEEQAMRRAAARLSYRFNRLKCMAFAADFTNLDFLNNLQLPPLRRAVFYPGSTIGNFEPTEAIKFLRQLRALVGFGGGLLIGVDLEKDAALLDRAYNDREGVTAQFNLNVLNNVNRITGSNFDPRYFSHQAFYNSQKRRVEMHLCSKLDHTVKLGDNPITLKAGESIHTENSYKYSTESFSALAAEAGFIRARTWFDKKRLFSVHYFVADEGLAGDADEHGLLTFH